jgi:hypothetical protein
MWRFICAIVLVPPNNSAKCIDRENLHRELSSLATENTVEYGFGNTQLLVVECTFYIFTNSRLRS